MIELYNKIQENYHNISSDGYYMERFKSFPFQPQILDSRHSIHNSLVSSINSQLKELSKAIKHIVKEVEAGDYSHAAYGMKESYQSFKRGKYDRLFSQIFSTHFSQLATVADEASVDYSDLTDRLDRLLIVSKASFSYMSKMADFIHDYVELEPYLKESQYNPDELSLYLEDLTDLLERNKKLISMNIDYLDYNSVIAPQIREFKILKDDMLFRIKTKSPDAFFNMSNYYHHEVSQHSGDLATFMLDKKYEDTIEKRITLTQSQKIQDFIVFADESVCYKKGGEYHLIKDKADHRAIFSELEHSIISYQLRKKPKLANYISKLYNESGDGINPVGKLTNVLIVINTYLNNEQILKNMKMDLSVFENKSFEAIDDHMNELINKHKLTQYANAILSNKNKHLLTDTSLEHFKILMDSGISKSVIQNMIGKKMAAIHTSEEFDKYLEKVIEHVSGFNEEILMEKLNGNKIKPAYHENNVVVFEIDTFEQSKSFGSPSWCISRHDHYFNDYKSEGSKQYFLYDFNKNEKDNQSMIGFTVRTDGSMRTQHAKNDDYHRVDEFLEKIVNKILYTQQDKYNLDHETLKKLNEEFNVKTKKNVNKVQSI